MGGMGVGHGRPDVGHPIPSATTPGPALEGRPFGRTPLGSGHAERWRAWPPAVDLGSRTADGVRGRSPADIASGGQHRAPRIVVLNDHVSGPARRYSKGHPPGHRSAAEWVAYAAA